MSCPARIYPLRKPKNHRPPVPRWQVVLPHGTSHVFTTYIGLQRRSTSQEAAESRTLAKALIQEWLEGDDGPLTTETLAVIDGSDVASTDVWVCYWTGEAACKRSLEALSLRSVHSKLSAAGRDSIGLWRESFVTEVSRLETNHSGLDYLPGLARVPGASTEEHMLATYWGAARDRIPSSAYDLFPPVTDAALPEAIPQGTGQYLVGTNHENLVHIRSGQFWENCGPAEAGAYESKLEPVLRAGLAYLWDQPRETGAYGLRYLRNTAPVAAAQAGSEPLKETCGAGFFANLETLEAWAKGHPSHLAIYRGALSHYKEFGDSRRLRTWHEISVLRAGDAHFEYVNCAPGTGVMACIHLEAQKC